jgi:hypothetical protein
MPAKSHFCFGVIFVIIGKNRLLLMQYESLTKRTWGIAIVLFIITLVAVYFKMRGAPVSVALRYNVIVGVNEIGNKYELLKIPVTGLLIGGVNYSLTRLQKFDRTLLPFLAALVSALVNMFLLIAVLFLFRVS